MKTKRFLSALLALLLVCSLPVSAFAADFPDNPSSGDVAGIDTGKTMDKNDGIVHSNNGTVTTNNGTVVTNNGTVQNNESKVTTNNGTVVTNNGAVFVNNNTLVTNNGSVSNNGTANNNANAKVTTNNNTVLTNNGTVTINNGSIDINNGTVTTNNDYVYHNAGTVETNAGTVRTNENSGTVTTNNDYVEYNHGTVNTNNITGTVNNRNNGTVTTNYGTVTEADGTIRYGLQVDNDGYITLEQKNAGEIWDLAQFFTKAGYVLTGYTQAYQTGENGLAQASTTVEGTSYTADCPNVLTLIWQAIVSPVTGEIAAATDNGTGSFGPGSSISINGHQYLLVAVVEDVYCLASVDSFEDEALSALPALLASLLTEEQLSHVSGQPELLDEALTARFFGGQGSHIVFPCDSGLIFS